MPLYLASDRFTSERIEADSAEEAMEQFRDRHYSDCDFGETLEIRAVEIEEDGDGK